MDDFEWPCEKRTAHGPHLVECGEESTCGLDIFDCDDDHNCPGVKAHPDTMIGRARHA